jgi:hypothetical protein
MQASENLHNLRSSKLAATIRFGYPNQPCPYRRKLLMAMLTFGPTQPIRKLDVQRQKERFEEGAGIGQERPLIP